MKIEVLFEDNGDGSVRVKCTPDAEHLFKKYKERRSMTPAECMALVALSSAINSDANAPIIEKMSGKDKPLIIV